MTAGGVLMTAVTAVLVWVAVAAGRERFTARHRFAGRWAVLGLWAVTAVVLVRRFTGGLGAASAMSDRFPWGIWIGLDVMSGVALAAGGFVMAATVHVFRLRRFEPVLRPTILTAFLGYQLVAAALMIDVGRPYRIWHPLVMWQDHSIMFEVAWCVTLYSTVLALEFSPVVFERLGLDAARRAVHVIVIPLVILGVILSTMHQSSLGSLFLIIPGKLSALWYSPLLPVLFLLSAVAVGLAMTIVESIFSSRTSGEQLPEGLLRELARAMTAVLSLYALVRFVDLAARGAWTDLTAQPLQAASLALEIGAGVVAPFAVVGSARGPLTASRMLVAALLVIAGVVLNRLNVSWIGLLPYTGRVYVPSWMEVAVTLSFLTAGIAVFGQAVRRLPVYRAEPAAA